MKSFRGETRIVSDARDPIGSFQSPSLIRGIVRARGWYDQIVRGEVASFEDLARQNRVTSRYVRRMFRCALLAPGVVESVGNGQMSDFSFEMTRSAIPLDWPKQKPRKHLPIRIESRRSTYRDKTATQRGSSPKQ